MVGTVIVPELRDLGGVGPVAEGQAVLAPSHVVRFSRLPGEVRGHQTDPRAAPAPLEPWRGRLKGITLAAGPQQVAGARQLCLRCFLIFLKNPEYVCCYVLMSQNC